MKFKFFIFAIELLSGLNLSSSKPLLIFTSPDSYSKDNLTFSLNAKPNLKPNPKSIFFKPLSENIFSTPLRSPLVAKAI